jgi:phosphomannomutase
VRLAPVNASAAGRACVPPPGRASVSPIRFAPSLIATHSGLRGRPAVDLTPDVVAAAVSGFVELLRRRSLPPTLAVASDERREGRALAREAIRAALACGADVTELGAVSTPAAKLAARARGLGGAVVVTGSHLEPEWNGLKLSVAPHYAPVDVRALPVPSSRRSEPRGRLHSDGRAAGEHAGALLASVQALVIREAGLRVACTGGAGSAAALFLEGLGCSAQPPLDVTLRLDADGDRLRLEDERGRPLDPEVTLPLVALASGARRVVKGLDTSRMIDRMVTGSGGRVLSVPPGEIHLVSAVLAHDADLAGEGNGGVVRPAVGLARDGLAAAAAVLELRARSSEPLSALAAGLPRFVRRRSSVPCRGVMDARRALDRAAAALGAAWDDVDAGVLFEGMEETWALVRPSATEPVLRVTVEARDAEAADDLHVRLCAALVP